MAGYRLLIKPSAAREIDAIRSKRDRQRIIARIAGLARDPRPRDCEKLAGSEGRLRIRQGNYRVVNAVDDAGRPIVFVQREGETFERRAVTLGARAGDLVQITEGVKPGDRVVTKGAYLLRLASLSTSVPAHGHVH